MATREEIFQAIRNADAAGDTDSVRKLGAYLQTMGDGAAHDKAKAETEAWAKTINPTDGMSGMDKFVAGYGKLVPDLVMGARQLGAGVADFASPRQQSVTSLVTGQKTPSRVDELRAEVAERRRLDAPLMATGAGTAGNITAGLATFAPTALIPGANTITGGALIGAVSGALQPSASGKESLTNLMVGGAGGAAVPAVVRGIRVVRAAAEPFYEAGRNAIVGRALNRAAGNDAQAVAARLREAGEPFVGPSQGAPRTTMGEYVPGSLPTVGQAAGNPGVAALERAAAATNPEVTNAMSGMMQAQNTARVNALTDMAGRDGRREFTQAMRDGTSNQLYGDARRAGIDPAALTPEAQANMARFAERLPEEVLNKARQLAQINGEPMTNATSLQGLHYVKMAIDDLIGASQRSGNNTLTRAYTGLQQDLLAGMDRLSPAYQQARRTHAQMSRPLNQMDTAGAIADASINPLSGNLQPAAFARALSDRTAARATGLPSATLEGTMEPAQMNALQSILLDLQRANAAQTVGRGVGSDTVQKLAYSNMLDQAGVPTFLRELAPAQVVGNVGGRVADAAYARANRELSNRLAEVMLDPAMASQLMFSATPRQQSQLLRLAQRGGSGLALTAPAATNAQK